MCDMVGNSVDKVFFTHKFHCFSESLSPSPTGKGQITEDNVFVPVSNSSKVRPKKRCVFQVT